MPSTEETVGGGPSADVPAGGRPSRPPGADGPPRTDSRDERDAPDGQDTGAARRWCLGTRLLVAATAVWALLLALHLLLAGRWWLWVVVEATPPLTLVAVPLLLLALVPLARPVRRWLSAVQVVLLLAGAHLAGYGPGWGGTTDAPPGTEVKVFSWSTDYWQMTDDKDAFYAFLRRQDADVYLLQEYLYWEGDQPVRIDDSARLRAEFPGYRISVEGELLTLSRLPVVREHHDPVAAGGTDWYWKGTKAQRTDIRVGGSVVSFYNVHLAVPFRVGDNPLSGRFWDFTKDQSDWRNSELRKLRTDLTDNPHPAVVAGDFNSPWMKLTPLGAGTRLHSPDASLLPARSWPVSDYPLPRLWRLDWLFTDGGLAVPSYRFGGGEDFSDHAAQEIRVVVPDTTD
ncbi:endonuclease/exonuclease/phosphatase family protein [Streptomyces sp. NPDC003247]|uniref:endonuclease/exonuclease/phosphatase family protein n=1 Tax=Streptomyces sp. NPDC003247 TaxID=3364677 RepID=UPI0036B0F76D